MPDETPETPTQTSTPSDAGESTTPPEATVTAPEADVAPDEAAPATQTTESSGAGEVAAPAEPEVVLSPKERRSKRRAAKAPAPSGPRSLEDRVAARQERRARNAKQRRAYRTRAKTKRAERGTSEAVEPIAVKSEHGPGRPKVRQGIVVSDKADKTIVVRVDVARRHRRYGKIMRTSSKLHAHDEVNHAHEGDTVRVIESRPLSATKRWRLVDVLERAK